LKTGFALGSSIQSKTKGIWAWCMEHPKQKDQVLMLLDTEGLGDVEKVKIDICGNINMFSELTLIFSVFSICNLV
jgi:hypothetical protein